MRGGPIQVRAPAGDPLVGRASDVAAALGVDVEVEEALAEQGEGRVSIGDVEIPPGAPDWLVEAAVLRALGPRHVLFLCVANSARSQLAEGLARALAPDSTRISSAGSSPTSVRPQAIAALHEIEIDTSALRSTGMDDIDRTVDAVITLCAEEVCPVWLGEAWRLHWGLPDPAAVSGAEEEVLDAFRAVRDELRKRLGVLFTGRLQ